MNGLAIINNFRTVIRKEYSQLIEKYANTTIKEIDNGINEYKVSLKVSDWKAALNRMLNKLDQISQSLPLIYDVFKIKGCISEANELLKMESNRYKYLCQNAKKYKLDLIDIYQNNIEEIVDGYFEDVDVYRSLFKRSNNKNMINSEQIIQYFRDRTKEKDKVDAQVKQFIDNEINRFKELEKEEILKKMKSKCSEIDKTFDEISKEVNSLRDDAIIEVNNYVGILITILSDKQLFKCRELDEFISLLSTNYNIDVDISIDGMGSVIPDEIITKIYSDYLNDTIDREFLLNVMATLNVCQDFDKLSTKDLCLNAGKILGLVFD